MLNMYWFEIKRFFKEHLKFIIIGTIILSIIFSLSITFFGDQTSMIPSNPEEEGVETEEEVFDNDSRMAYFRFYIKHPDGRVFSNQSTVHELFTRQDMYAEVLSETGVDLQELQEEVRLESEFEEFQPVRVNLNGSSNIYTAVFETGDNNANLELAEFYYQYLMNENFEILEANSTFSFTPPQLIEEIELEEEVEVDSTSIGFGFIVYIVIGLFIGVALTTIFALIKEFFSKKLNYAFTYIPEETNNFIIYNSSLGKNNLLRYFIVNPKNNNKVFLSEEPLSTEYKELINDTEEITNLESLEKRSLADAPINTEHQEIIIIVSSGETTRKWFEDQINLSRLHDLTVKTIQINN